MNAALPERDKGSLRDPDGAVIHWRNKIFRGLSAEAHRFLVVMRDAGVLSELEQKKLIVPTRFDPDAAEREALAKAFPMFAAFVEHDRVPVLSYPCEWTFSMLCDAALLHLDIQLSLLPRGFSLKDASAYNVQFTGARPVFIDLSSIERAASSVWPAYGQFCRMFLFPLMLAMRGGFDTKGMFLTRMDGLPLAETMRAIGWLGALAPGNFPDIFLPSLLERGGDRSEKERAAGQSSETSTEVQMWNLRRLRRRIRGFRDRPARRGGEWVSYERTRTYEATEIDRKKKIIAEFLDAQKPESVLDLGANTGEFSIMAAGRSGRVIAVDADHDALDELYRRSAAEVKNIQPVWTDLANPTPRFGFASEERASFAERAASDATLALALVHHLLVTGGIPVERIADFLWSLTSRALAVEYVGPQDPQFKSLIGFRNLSYEYFTEAVFEKAFTRSGAVVKKESLTPHRTLYLLTKKS